MKRERIKAFTLIELLVVISIIALLVGILLPALGAARRSAQALVCQANMKNLTAAFVTYATDNNGWWPSYASLGAGSDPKNLTVGAWIPMAGLASTGQPYAVDLADGSIWDYTPDYGVFQCPSDPWFHLSSGLSYTASNHVYRNVRNNFYAQTSMEPGIEVATTNGKAIYAQSDKFVAPSNLVFMIDEGGPAEDANLPGGRSNVGVNDGHFENLYSDQPGGNNSAGSADKTKWYHSDGAAFGFADGHGQILKKTDREIYGFSRNQLVGPSKNRRFEYGRIWDPAAQAPIIAGQP